MSQPRAQLVRAGALRIARELAESAIWHDDMCVFQGATLPASLGLPPRYQTTGADLYLGSAGVSRFLAYAARRSGDETLERVARGAILHALRFSQGWSLFGGGVGVGVAALEVAAQLGTHALIGPALHVLERAADEAVAHADCYDYLLGVAGVIVGLEAALPHLPSWEARRIELGEVLLRIGDAPSEGAMSWPMSRADPLRLCGLSHGASGFALAFESLHRSSASRRDWRGAAAQARAFERRHYMPEAGSWTDLRPLEGDTHPGVCPHMWCHGSVGVVAERLRVAQPDEAALADAIGGLAGARAHVDSLLAGASGPGASDALNCSLCHGLAGFADLFVDAWRYSGDRSWLSLAEDVAVRILDDGRRPQGWRSGVPGGWPTPGLMLGTAGIGHTLLRVADPEAVASGWNLGEFLRDADAGTSPAAPSR